MRDCHKCHTGFDADELDECPKCGTRVLYEVCPDCNAIFDTAVYGEHNCPFCHEIFIKDKVN
jgi:DNA-directed RNA polymerase subunit RPC12/RpoP